MTIKSLLPELELPSTNSLTLVITHITVNRSIEVDEILNSMCIYDHHLIACAAESILYSNPTGIYGIKDNQCIEELWEYALPYAVYENGDSFEKKVLYNMESIYRYMMYLYGFYQSVIYNGIVNKGSVNLIHCLSKQGAVILTGNNFSLINIGRTNDELYHIYDTPPTFPFPIRPRTSVKNTQ